jgi:hypothetical protein
MASSKSTTKELDRTKLFFNKFCYRTVITVPNSHWVQKVKTVDDYLEKIKELYDLWNTNKNRYHSSWYREPINPEDIDKARVEKIIKLVTSNKDKSLIKYRCEGDNLQVYTNDLKLVTEFAKFVENNLITKVNQCPDGIMYFKKDPPAKYRAYMTNNKMPIEFREEFLTYLTRTPDVKPSDAFYAYIHRSSRRYQTWLWDTYFVDYNNEQNLMMMHLMFPKAIGKSYKLEKK